MPPGSQVRVTRLKMNKSPTRSWVLSQAHRWAVSQSPHNPPPHEVLLLSPPFYR